MPSEYGSSALGSHRHVVQFYDGDEELAENAGSYLAGAITDGGAAVIVATPGRCAAFETRLAAEGVDVGVARRDGTLVCLDATRVAQRLSQGGRVDLAAFGTQFRPAILAAGEAPGPVRIYGEVVALLWAAGHVNAALELEGLWNELGRRSRSRCSAATRGIWWTAASIGRGRRGLPPAQLRWSAAPAVRQDRTQRPARPRLMQPPGLPPGPLDRGDAHVRGKPGGHPGGPRVRARDARAMAW